MSSYVHLVPRISIGLLVSAVLWMGTSASASERGTDQFIVRVYSNGQVAQDLMSGRYDAALAKIDASKDLNEPNSFTSATNLCVAEMMAGRFESARSACDAAVKSTRSSAIATPTWGPPAGGAHQSVRSKVAQAQPAF